MSTASVIELDKANCSVAETVNRFEKLFNNLSSENIGDITQIYSEDVNFRDPFSQVEGIDELTGYFTGAYANVLSCQFEFGDPVINGKNVCLPWIMRLQHKRIRNGRLISVDGISQLRIHGGRVTAHRDYFDAGQLLYENLPILGRAIRWIRSQAG